MRMRRRDKEDAAAQPTTPERQDCGTKPIEQIHTAAVSMADRSCASVVMRQDGQPFMLTLP